MVGPGDLQLVGHDRESTAARTRRWVPSQPRAATGLDGQWR